MSVSLVIGGLLVGCMIGISVYAARVLPSDVRIPLHYGLGSYNNFASKTIGLIMWPAAGLVVYGIFAAIAVDVLKPNHSGGAAPVLFPVVLAVLVVGQVGAIRAAMANSGSRL